jgi:hypothetical protein
MARQAIPKTASAGTLSAESATLTPGQGIADAPPDTLQKLPQSPAVGADDLAKGARRDGSRYRPMEEREPAGPASEPNSPMRSPPASEPSAESSTSFDRLLHAEFGRLTLGVSPFAPIGRFTFRRRQESVCNFLRPGRGKPPDFSRTIRSSHRTGPVRPLSRHPHRINGFGTRRGGNGRLI